MSEAKKVTGVVIFGVLLSFLLPNIILTVTDGM